MWSKCGVNSTTLLVPAVLRVNVLYNWQPPTGSHMQSSLNNVIPRTLRVIIVATVTVFAIQPSRKGSPPATPGIPHHRLPCKLPTLWHLLYDAQKIHARLHKNGSWMWWMDARSTTAMICQQRRTTVKRGTWECTQNNHTKCHSNVRASSLLLLSKISWNSPAYKWIKSNELFWLLYMHTTVGRAIHK